MKILIIGATGRIGREALAQSLAHPRVTSVVAFVRRDLPAHIAARHDPDTNDDGRKLRCVRVTDADFASWPDRAVLREHADAVGAIWCVGFIFIFLFRAVRLCLPMPRYLQG